MEFQTEDEAKENERSPNVALLCAGLLRRGMVYELERVLRVCNGLLCSMSVTYEEQNLAFLESKCSMPLEKVSSCCLQIKMAIFK